MISVLVPVYNRKNELNNLLQSFVDEYLKNHNQFEIIIIDDLSDDGSYEIAKSFVENYNFFKLITSGYKSPGMSRNIGSKIAKFDWLLFCDSDNLMVKNWSILLQNILENNTSYDGIWFPAKCNNKVLTSQKYLKIGNHLINPYFYFNNYIGEVVHCIKKEFLLNNNYYYLKGTTNDFPDLLWFVLFANKKYKVFFYNLIIQEYYINSKNRISTDSSLEKNFSQIIHYKLVIFKIIKTKYVFSKYFIKIVFKFFFFILIVDDKLISLKAEVGILRFLSRISFKIGLSNFLLKKLFIKRNSYEGIVC
jgi:glycosyltransferase involved in cell wall biosynthesis